MKRSKNYNTKQRDAILDYIISLEGNHATAAQIVEYFIKKNVSIGRTTIYRHLDKLTQSGIVRRYTTDGISGACYQYVGDKEICHTHLHLKCESCGKLQHLECETLYEIEQHVLGRHAFKVNALKTVLYGQCDHCLKKS
jgi:Fur family ferric uptake transcriptional regulator